MALKNNADAGPLGLEIKEHGKMQCTHGVLC
ncbi:uncharacterized protein G2W53_023874 [Senna tora]|uniref:Uncharacterized protein n=1 Tax=Senna tora TaxID=362788 RepID=A0A834WIL0_9FABA|nr:uncharacterized protein G2W53_023874 [Senna tora]